MVSGCVLKDCSSRTENSTLRKVHCFPSNDEQRKKWEAWVTAQNKNSNFKSFIGAALCAEHFCKETCFEPSGRLKKGAVPTITPECTAEMPYQSGRIPSVTGDVLPRGNTLCEDACGTHTVETQLASNERKWNNRTEECSQGKSNPQGGSELFVKVKHTTNKDADHANEQLEQDIYVLEDETLQYAQDFVPGEYGIEEPVYALTSVLPHDEDNEIQTVEVFSSIQCEGQSVPESGSGYSTNTTLTEAESLEVEETESAQMGGGSVPMQVKSIIGRSQKTAEERSLTQLYKQIEIKENSSKIELKEWYDRACAEKTDLRNKILLMQRKCNRIIERIVKKRQKIEEKVRSDEDCQPARKKKKVEVSTKKQACNLEEIVLYLEKEEQISEGALRVLRCVVHNAISKPFQEDGKGVRSKDKEFSPEVKVFSKTLLLFSSEAYHNVRDAFDAPIPPASVTRTWFNTGLGQPGWSSEAFLMVKDEVYKTDHCRLDCSVIMGEFSLNPGTYQGEKNIVGHINFGTACDIEEGWVEDLPLARSALFLLVVPLDPLKKWRIPLAYFLIDSLMPEERANIILECLWRLYNMGSMVLSVVMDAQSTSRATAQCLGVCFAELPFPSTSFPHPADGLHTVHVFFDPSHLSNLVRHTWASVAVLIDENGEEINWKYFTELIRVQETQAGCTEQSDTKATWYWDKTLMRKRLMAQVFSATVADAMECCCLAIQLPQFYGCESTVAFIRMMDKIFQLFKSRSILPSLESPHQEWKIDVIEALNYIFVLRDKSGQSLFATNCKVPFVCVYINLISLMELVKLTPALAVSRLSFDGLDLLFLDIRKYLDWKECPSVEEFMAAYLTHLQNDGIASHSSFVQVNCGWWIDLQDVSNTRQEGSRICQPVFGPENVCGIPPTLTFYPVLLPTEMQRFRASQLILVHTLKRVAELLHCDNCILGLQMQYVQDNPTLVLLRKTCGGFVYPSQSVVEICASAERHLKAILRSASHHSKGNLFNNSNSKVVQQVSIAVMGDFLERSRRPFLELQEHSKDCISDSNHVCRLIRALVTSYVLIRIRPLREWHLNLSSTALSPF